MRKLFVGKPDKNFPGLKTGNIYNIEVKETREFSFLGIKFGRKFILVTGDITCPYNSWKAFYKNWKPVADITLDILVGMANYKKDKKHTHAVQSHSHDMNFLQQKYFAFDKKNGAIPNGFVKVSKGEENMLMRNN